MRRLLALVLLFVAAGTACADTLHGVVIVVIDGDTVLFKPDHYSLASRAFLKVRLADIDAPEKDQPYGDAATRALQERVLKREVALETVATDVYGRMVGRLTLGSVPVNAELVRQGFAWASSRDPNHAMRALQREAQGAQRGLWQVTDPTPPWVWRRTHARLVDRAFSR